MSVDVTQATIAPLTQAEAEAVAAWRYEPPYDFYDATADEGDLAELLDPVLRGETYFAVRGQAGALVAYAQLRPAGDTVVVGIGLRPDLTGRGLGLAVVEQVLAFAQELFAPSRFRLSVAVFNRRALAVYERAGFRRTREITQETNGGVFRFVEMERPA